MADDQMMMMTKNGSGGGGGGVNYKMKRKRRPRGLTSKCASLVKEQRARIYILRRCATMLCCWYIHGDEN